MRPLQNYDRRYDLRVALREKCFIEYNYILFDIFLPDVNEIPGNPCPSTLPNIDPKTIKGAEVLILNSIDPDNSNKKKQKISYSLQNLESPFKVIGDRIVVDKVFEFYYL